MVPPLSSPGEGGCPGRMSSGRAGPEQSRPLEWELIWEGLLTTWEGLHWECSLALLSAPAPSFCPPALLPRPSPGWLTTHSLHSRAQRGGSSSTGRKFLTAQKQSKHGMAAQQVVSSQSLARSTRGEHRGAGHCANDFKPGDRLTILVSTYDSFMETIILKSPYNFAEP